MRTERWLPVSSANLLRLRYRESSRALDVVFRAAPRLCYTYGRVDLIDYILVITDTSVGSMFNSLVRSRPDLHPYTRRRL